MAERNIPHSPRELDVRGQIALAARRGYPYYVYTLADSQGVFYVGKGKGARVFQHGRLGTDMNARKLARIAGCAAAGPRRQVIAFFRDEAAALTCEATHIAEQRDSLTNILPGGIRLTPKERAQFKAWQSLQRVVPRDQYKPPAWLDKATALMVYDLIVATLEKLVVEPDPTTIQINKDGSISYGYDGAEP